MPLRALARVDLGAIERNCARLRRRPRRRALCAVVKADGYGHGAVAAARAAQAGGASVAGGGDRGGGARRCAAAGIDGPAAGDGRAVAARSSTVALAARRRRRRVARGRSRRARRAGRRRGVHVKLDTGHGPARHARRDEATRVAAAVAAAPELRLAGAMTHFATADDDPGVPRRAARASSTPWARDAAGRPPGLLAARRQLGGDAARAGRALRPRALRDRASTAWTRSSATPPTTASSRRWSCVSYVAEVKRVRAGGERRLRPPLRRRARRPALGDDPDRLRRRRAARADQQRRRARRRPARAAGRHGLDGQHHRRPRRRTRRSRAGSRRC